MKRRMNRSMQDEIKALLGADHTHDTLPSAVGFGARYGWRRRLEALTIRVDPILCRVLIAPVQYCEPCRALRLPCPPYSLSPRKLPTSRTAQGYGTGSEGDWKYSTQSMQRFYCSEQPLPSIRPCQFPPWLRRRASSRDPTVTCAHSEQWGGREDQSRRF